MYTIENLKQAIEREMHGRTVDRLQDVYETAYDAALILMSSCDLKESQRTTQISPQLFDDVYAYSAPADFKSIIDVYPTEGRRKGYENQEDFRRTGQKEFSMRGSIEAPMVSEKWLNGARFLLLRKYPSMGQRVQLESFDSETGVTEIGDVGTLATNRLTFWEGSASLSLELSGATGSGAIEKTLSSQDLTNYKLLSSWFIKVYIPSGFSSRFTSFTIQHGNSNGVDWSKTVTTQHDGTAFRDGMNLLRFDWSSASESGTVDETVMDYMRLTFTYSSGTAIPGVLVDDFNIQMGTMYDLDYYSNYLFMSNAGVWKEKPTEDTDRIMLSTDSYRIFADLASMLACGEVKSLEDDFKRLSKRVGYPVDPDRPFAGLLGEYKRMNPSQRPVHTTITRDYGV